MNNFTLPPSWAEALDLIKISMPDAVIAGGALRDLILGRQIKDIDVFAQARWDMPSAGCLKEWLESTFDCKAKTVINDAWAAYNNAMDGVAFAVELNADNITGYPLQVITMRCPMTLQSAVKRIDFGICRVAHDGHELYQHPDFLHDQLHKCFTLRDTARSPANRERSFKRHERLQAKYPGWPMVEPIKPVAPLCYGYRYQPPLPPTPARRVVLPALQKTLCEVNKWPHFAPTNGVCWSCHGDTVTERWGKELITVCGRCARSYCD